jgi:hypothetical protein
MCGVCDIMLLEAIASYSVPGISNKNFSVSMAGLWNEF